MSLPDLVHVDHEFFFMQLSCAWQFLLDQGDFPLRSEVLTYTFRVANNSPVSHYAFSARKFVRVQDSWSISDLSVLYTTRISTRNIRHSSIRGDTYHSFQSILVLLWGPSLRLSINIRPLLNWLLCRIYVNFCITKFFRKVNWHVLFDCFHKWPKIIFKFLQLKVKKINPCSYALWNSWF